MLHRVKLIVKEQPSAEHVPRDGTTIWTRSLPQTAESIFDRGEPALWEVKTYAGSNKSPTTMEYEKLKIIQYIEKQAPDYLMVAVDDARTMLTLLLRPRVPIDIPGSTIDYFETNDLMEYLIDSFLQDLNIRSQF